MDRAHERLSGPARQGILKREHAEFGNRKFTRLPEISVAHLYNLRNSAAYRKVAAVFVPTRPSPVSNRGAAAARPARRAGSPATAKKSRYLTRPEIDALLSVADRTIWDGRRDHALLLTLYNSGARVSKITGVRHGDIVLDAPASLKLHGKGRKERAVPLWAKTAQVLRVWFQ